MSNANADVLVLEDVEAVAAHLVDDPPGLGRGIPQACSDVDVVFLEEHPGFGPFRCRLAGVGLHLNEPGYRRHCPGVAFVQCAVQGQLALELDGRTVAGRCRCARSRPVPRRRRRTRDQRWCGRIARDVPTGLSQNGGGRQADEHRDNPAFHDWRL